MDILKNKYSITELSEYLNITDHTLRYYEKEFSISVPKDSRGRRYYTAELYNLMYKIKSMRNDGLEIKAIKKILESSELMPDPPPVAVEDEGTELMITTTKNNFNKNEFNHFLTELTGTISCCVSNEVNSAKELLIKELNKSKLELGACVEHNFRKLESKMDRHFAEVDRSITVWRARRKKGFFKRLFSRVTGKIK